MIQPAFFKPCLKVVRKLQVFYCAHKESLVLGLFFFIGLLIFIRNLSVENAVIFHDEYVYKARSDLHLNQADITARQLAPEIPNIIYTSVFSIGSFFGKNNYIFSKLLNIIFFCAAACPIFLLSKIANINFNQSVFVALAATLLPFANYTNYFMPESMYYFVYWTSAFLYFKAILSGMISTAFLAGLSSGILYYIKPHAGTIILINTVFLLFVPIQSKVKVLLFNLVGNATAILLCTLFWGTAADLTSGGYGGILSGLFHSASSVTTNWIGFTKDIGYVAFGHLLYASLFYSLPFIIAIVILFRKRKMTGEHAIYHLSSVRGMITDYALVSLLTLASLTIIYTVLSHELGRVHSRYYSFLYPYFLLVLFFYQDMIFSKKTIMLIGTLLILFYTLSYIYYPIYSDIIYLSFVSDGQEAGFISFGKFTSLFFVILMWLISMFVLYFRQHCWTYICSIIILSIMISICVWEKQIGVFNNRFTKGREAIFLQELLGENQLSQTVVVADSKGVVSKFLFNLNGTPHVEYRKSGTSTADIFEKYPDASILVALRTDYIMSSDAKCFSYQNQIIVCYRENSK